MQNGILLYTTLITYEGIHEHFVNARRDLPSDAPDMKPIENVCSRVKKSVFTDYLIEHIQDVWGAISTVDLKNVGIVSVSEFWTT